MKLLLISALAPPVNSPESVQAGRYIHNLKNTDITLVSARGEGAWEPQEQTLQALINGVTRIELPLWPRLATRIIGKLAPALLFPDPFAPMHRQLKRVVSKVTQEPDVIMSRSTPFSSAVLGMKCAEYYKKPWIMHISDPLVDNAFFNHPPALKRRLNELESLCFCKATRVTVTSQQTVSLYEKKYPEHGHKLRLLPNVFDEDDMNSAPIDFEGTLNFVFTGRIYGYRRVHEWLDAVEEATKRQPGLALESKVSLVGYFPVDSLERISASTAPQVKYQGPVSIDEVKKHQREATVLICLDGFGPNPTSDVFFPSKLQDYLAAGRKVIALARSTSTVYEFLDGQYGWCFDLHELPKLPDLLLEIYEYFKRKDASYFKLSSGFMEYSAQFQSKRLEKLFEEVVNP